MAPADIINNDYSLDHWAYEFLQNRGVSDSIAEYIVLGIDLIIIAIIAIIADRIARNIILRVIKRVVSKSSVEWDDLIYEEKVFDSLAHIAPAAVIRYLAPIMFTEFTGIISGVIFLTNIYIFIVIARVAIRLLNSLQRILAGTEMYKDKPIESYVQLGKIIVYLGVIIYVIAFLIGTNPLTVLTTLGAATAVLLLIFRDPILGLVASITISANDTLRIGDWVSFEKFGADGDVIRINLTSVQIRNWDNTISSVPTYAFQSESFKNWRNMQNLGARRIMRSVNIKVKSVKFLNDKDLEKFSKIQLLADHIQKKKADIEQWNKEHEADKSVLINGRNMTNLGLFREYATRYLKTNPNLHDELTMMVRQLQPTEKGVPIQVYAFCRDTRWVYYEGIQADIFDHLLSAIEFFDLEVFEYPSGSKENNTVVIEND